MGNYPRLVIGGLETSRIIDGLEAAFTDRADTVNVDTDQALDDIDRKLAAYHEGADIA